MAKVSKDEYNIGYGKPPEVTRFKKGESGNPQGRPRGKRNVMTILEDVMFAKVQVSEGGHRVKKTKLEIALTQLINKAASGDLKATKMLIALCSLRAEHEPESKNSPDLVADREMAIKLATRMCGLIENLDKDSNDE